MTLGPRGQALVEFALVLPLLLFIILGGMSLGFVFLDRMRLEHATMEAAIAGASDPSPPRRCEVAEQTVAVIYGLAPDTFRCTGIGDRLQIDTSHNLPLLIPFAGDVLTIAVSESAMVRK